MLLTQHFEYQVQDSEGRGSKYQTSLSYFVENCCVRSPYDDDMVPVELFIKNYNTYCRINH